MATAQADSTQAEVREESHEERCARLALERNALRPSPAYDSLRERLLALLGCNLYSEDYGTDYGPAHFHEQALFRYASATTKAVAMALQGTHYVTANEGFDTEFTTDEAATVLCGLSALLEEGPDLVKSLRDATRSER